MTNCAIQLADWNAAIAAEDWTAAWTIHQAMREECGDPVGMFGAPQTYLDHINYLELPVLERDLQVVGRPPSPPPSPSPSPTPTPS